MDEGDYIIKPKQKDRGQFECLNPRELGGKLYHEGEEKVEERKFSKGLKNDHLSSALLKKKKDRLRERNISDR